MNRLIKQSVAATATLMLASAAHANIVTYDFTGSLTIGPMGQLAVPQAFSGHVSFHDSVQDQDQSYTHGQYEDHRQSAEFVTTIDGQNFTVRGGHYGEVDVDIYDNDPSVTDPAVDANGGPADALGVFASNQFLSMGFFLIYGASDFGDVFLNDRISSISSTNAPLSGSGGFFIDEGYGNSYSGFFDTFTCRTCKPETSVPEPGMLTLSAAGLLMMGYTARRRRKVK